MTQRIRRVLALVLFVVPSTVLAATWEIDPSHSAATFAVRHMMITNVKGEFGKLSGTVELDDKDATKSKVEATIDATTINTREPKRDGHLKTADFFDVQKHPNLIFKSKKIVKAGANRLKVTGDLTMRGVTKEVVLDVETTNEAKDPYGNTRRGATATTKLNRTDWGLKWNQALEAGGVLVGEEVQVFIDLSLVKKGAQKS
ncbi:MAG: YceI family protein [Myxococcota bacterium]